MDYNDLYLYEGSSSSCWTFQKICVHGILNEVFIDVKKKAEIVASVSNDWMGTKISCQKVSKLSEI